MSNGIRSATLADTATVQRISLDAYRAAYELAVGYVPKPAREDYRHRISRGEVFVAEDDAGVAGVLVLEPLAAWLMIYSLAVAPKSQGHGTGRKLLGFAEMRAGELRLPELRLFTNKRMTRTISLYERCGFVISGERPHPGRTGECLVDMIKVLW